MDTHQALHSLQHHAATYIGSHRRLDSFSVWVALSSRRVAFRFTIVHIFQSIALRMLPRADVRSPQARLIRSSFCRQQTTCFRELRKDTKYHGFVCHRRERRSLLIGPPLKMETIRSVVRIKAPEEPSNVTECVCSSLPNETPGLEDGSPEAC